MGIFRSLAGSARLELTSADVSAALRDINAAMIRVWDVRIVGDLTVQFTASQKSIRFIEKIAERKGERLNVIGRSGLFWPIMGLRNRPVLVFGMAFLFALAIFVPGRVLFVRVEGNAAVPGEMILEAAQDAGICFGASRRAVRSEKVKNRLLGVMPQLQWAGVNTYGCTAVITVRERAQEQETKEEYPVSSIVASCDGVITSCTVTRGSGLCAVGQAVQKGQVLISGYVDCGQSITVTRSQGEIFAQTRHELTIVTPSETMAREELRDQRTYYGFRIGKKRINFVKGSGISDGTCVKMYQEYQLTLPGGHRLPISLVKETVLTYDLKPCERSDVVVKRQLSDFAKGYLQDHLVALVVLNAQEELTAEENRFLFHGYYHCTEMIGRERAEQIGEFHEKNG
ncbi:MAG: sporulation protein YqfD [Firmicutes bacterium]|nr:sporulation protein YqfD [Bacillota bacterium]